MPQTRLREASRYKSALFARPSLEGDHVSAGATPIDVRIYVLVAVFNSRDATAKSLLEGEYAPFETSTSAREADEVLKDEASPTSSIAKTAGAIQSLKDCPQLHSASGR